MTTIPDDPIGGQGAASRPSREHLQGTGRLVPNFPGIPEPIAGAIRGAIDHLMATRAISRAFQAIDGRSDHPWDEFAAASRLACDDYCRAENSLLALILAREPVSVSDAIRGEDLARRVRPSRGVAYRGSLYLAVPLEWDDDDSDGPGSHHRMRLARVDLSRIERVDG